VTSTETSRNRIRVFPLSPSLGFFNRDRKNQHTSSARERERVHETTRLLISLTRRTRKTEEDEQREREREREREIIKNESQKEHALRSSHRSARSRIDRERSPTETSLGVVRDVFARLVLPSDFGVVLRVHAARDDAGADGCRVRRSRGEHFLLRCVYARARALFMRSSRRNEERKALWRVKP
jgi:hypothetical protein